MTPTTRGARPRASALSGHGQAAGVLAQRHDRQDADDPDGDEPALVVALEDRERHDGRADVDGAAACRATPYRGPRLRRGDRRSGPAPDARKARRNRALRPSTAVLSPSSPADSGGGIRTRDLRVMSPTSYQTAPPRGGTTSIATGARSRQDASPAAPDPLDRRLAAALGALGRLHATARASCHAREDQPDQREGDDHAHDRADDEAHAGAVARGALAVLRDHGHCEAGHDPRRSRG